METLSLVIGIISLSALIWAVIENVFFVKRVLVNSNGCGEKSRKITKILFIISLSLAAVMIVICLCLFNTSITAVEFVNYIFFFFVSLPFLVILWMIIELVRLLFSKLKPNQGENEQERKPKSIFPILSVYLAGSIILMLALMRFYMLHATK